MGLVGATHRSLAIPQNFRVRILAASNMTTLIAGILGPMIAGVALTCVFRLSVTSDSGLS